MLAAGLALEEALAMSRDADLAFAHRLADAADAITMARFRASDLVVETKPDLTPVSEADRAAEEAIRALVARERAGRGRPRRGVRRRRRGRRAGSSTRSTGRRTTCAASRSGATLLALEQDGVVEVAVVSAPALGRRWWAVRGEGRVGRAASRAASRRWRGSRTASPRRPSRATCRRGGRRSCAARGRLAA